MTTYAQLQTAVEGRVIDLPTFVSTAVPGLINSALLEIQQGHNFRVMEAILNAQQTVVADGHELADLPDRFKEFRGDPYLITDAGDVKWLSIAAERQSVVGEFAADFEGEPKLLLVGEPSDDAGTAIIEVHPLPDGLSDYTNGEYRIYIPYWRYVTPLTADGDTNWFTENAKEYLEDRATALGFQLDHDYDSMALWTQTAEEWKRKVIKTDKLMRLGGVSTLVPHWRGVNSPLVRT